MYHINKLNFLISFFNPNSDFSTNLSQLNYVKQQFNAGNDSFFVIILKQKKL